MSNPRVFLIAGEPSGDKLGAALMAGLATKSPKMEFFGVGGPLMEAQGLSSLFPMEELSVMGITEVLPRLRGLLRRRDQTVAEVLSLTPDALITIDSPDFCLRVARGVKAASPIPTIHYVAPSVWAWRAKRAKKMRGVIDHVLALLPFEPPYMHAAGLGCDFVGHPVVSDPVASDDEAAAFRKKYQLGTASVVVALPGSRQGEVGRLTPVFGDTLARVQKSCPDIRVVIPAAEAVAERVSEIVSGWPGNPVVLDPRGLTNQEGLREKRAAFKAADVALAASGTVSLELAATETPMVVAYDMNWMSWQIMKRMALIDSVTLVNLVSETRTIPEFLGDACKPEHIAPALEKLISDADARAHQIKACQITMQRLGRGYKDPGLRAAEAVLAVIRDKTS